MGGFDPRGFVDLDGFGGAFVDELPAAWEAERALIGSLLAAQCAGYEELALVATDFFDPPSREAFEIMGRLAGSHSPVDVVTVANCATNGGPLLQMRGGAVRWLTGLAQRCAPSLVSHYGGLVRTIALERRLQAASNDIAAVVQRSGSSTLEKIEKAERILADVAKGATGANDPVSMAALLPALLDDLDARLTGSVVGIPSGFDDLDNLTLGWQRGDLIYVGARPSMGKTAFCTQIAAHASGDGFSVLMLSMEMSRLMVGYRLLSCVGRIPLEQLRRGALPDDSMDRLMAVLGVVEPWRLQIDDQAALGLAALRAKVRAHIRAQGGLDLLVVDYLQLMGGAGASRNAELEAISRGLKALAKEFNIAVVCISMLNRDLERRPNKRPILADLKDSGSIEQDADLVIFLYRDEVYNPDSPDVGLAEVIVGKQRNGPVGTVRLVWRDTYTRFDSFDTQKQ